MGGVFDSVKSFLMPEAIFGDSGRAADASRDAAGIQAAYMREALEYLKEREEIPQAFREEALTMLGGLYGLEGGEGDQAALIDQARTSPLYEAIMGGQEFGEEAILRNASATGGLRSGNVQSNMYDYNTSLQNRALLESYNQQLMGLTGLANLPSNANQIAGGMAGIGQTQAQGIIGAEQTRQNLNQQQFGNIMGLGGLIASMFSDRRLKTNIKHIGTEGGLNIYSWKWNVVANKMGLEGGTVGYLADEVFDIIPAAVTLRNNFMFVNYSMIGV